MRNLKFVINTMLVAAFGMALNACSKSNAPGGGDGGTPTTPYSGTYVSAGDTYDNSQGNPQAAVQGQRIRNRVFHLNDRNGSQMSYQSDIVLYFDNDGNLNAVANIDIAAFVRNGGGRRYDNNGYAGPSMNGFMGNQNGYPQQQGQANGLVQFKASNIPYEFIPGAGKIYISGFTASSNVIGQPDMQQNMYGGQQPYYGQQPQIAPAQQVQLGIRIGIFVDRNSHERIRPRRFRDGIEARLVDPVTRSSVASSKGFDPNTVSFDIGVQNESNEHLIVKSGTILPVDNGQNIPMNYNNVQPQPGQVPPGQAYVPQNLGPQFRFVADDSPSKNALMYVRPILDQQSDQRGFIN